MNFKYIANLDKGVNKWTTGEIKRIKQKFYLSKVQCNLLERVIRVRKRIDEIPEDYPLYIFGEKENITNLLMFTNLGKKNIVGIIVDGDVGNYFYEQEPYGNKYRLFDIDSEEIKTVQYVLLANIDTSRSFEDKIKEKIPQGTIIHIYKDELIPFWRIPKYSDALIEDSMNHYAVMIMKEESIPMSEYDIAAIRRLDKVNSKLSCCRGKRVIVYGAGGHTKELFRYTDLRYMNVIAIADRSKKSYRGKETRGIDVSSFCDAECIVISSYVYQEEIRKYLQEIGCGEKIVALYDEEDECEFYYNPNYFAPDLLRYNTERKDLSEEEIYAQAERCMQELSRGTDYYVTYSLVNNKKILKESYYQGEEEIRLVKGYETDNQKVAIVLQGPIIYEDNFTYDTIRLYKRQYPEATIILSTWKSEQEKEEFKKFETLDVFIVLSDLPKEKGIMNVNYQVKSTVEGVRKAEALGIAYVLKTRTDFRLHSEGVLSYLYNLIQKYPVSGGTRERLATLPTVLSNPAYFIPDFLIFGNVKDMKVFWDDEEAFPTVSIGRIPEVLLYSRYFKRIGTYIENPHEHMEEYIDMLCKELIIVDPLSFKYIWRKYSYENAIMFQEDKNLLTATDWFNWQMRRK